MGERDKKSTAGIIILMPSRGKPTIETLGSMGQTDGLPTLVVPWRDRGAGIVKGRNELAATAKKIPDKAPFVPEGGWYVLWVDDDAFWRPGTILRMVFGLQNPQVDVLGGWFTGRSPYAAPKAYRHDGSWPKPGHETKIQDGDIVEVASMGFHFVMHKLDVLEKLGPDPFEVKNQTEAGEDLAFCKRAREAGLRLWVHTGCPVAHIDDEGVAYLPGEGPMIVSGTELQKIGSSRKYGGLEPEDLAAESADSTGEQHVSNA